MKERSLKLAQRIWELRLQGMKLKDVAERCCCTEALVSHYTRYMKERLKDNGSLDVDWYAISHANKRGPAKRYSCEHVAKIKKGRTLRNTAEILGLSTHTVRLYLKDYRQKKS